MQFWELTAVFTAEGFRIDKTPTEDKNARFDQALFEKYAASPYGTLYERGFAPGSGEMPPSVTFLENIAARFIHEISRDADIEITREAKPPEKDLLADLLRMTPFVLGIEHVTPKWLGDIWKKLGAVFHREISSYSGSAAEYLKGKNSALNVAGRVFFHLVEHKSDDCPFAFLATYSTGSAKRVNHMPLKNALLEYKSDQNKLLALLSAVSGAAEKSDFISSLVESGELFSPLRFTPEDAYQFLRETRLYEECGIVCRVPDWWRKKGGARLSVSIGDREPAGLGLEAIMAFDPEIFLGELAMSREEIESLLTQAEGLSFIKGKWVEIDHDKLKAVLDAFGKIDDLGDMTFADAIRMQLGLSGALTVGGGAEVEVTRGEWLESLKKSLLNPSKAERVHVSGDFRAALRSYQQDGLNWLHLMGKMGFGALLADDMGLGKTVQILALLDRLRGSGKKAVKTLLVIPASLIHNWSREAERFAPRLRMRVVHTQNKTFDLSEADVFLTTYGMVTRLDALAAVKWDIVVLDEAQAIKNPSVKQTKAVKQLRAGVKIAMTGTPVENRLSDLWSIFDFLNKGLLGTGKEFTTFTKRLRDDPSGYSRLRDTVAPFILRRLKTDKSIISDLPDKVEVKAYAALTSKQAVLYNALVKDIAESLAGASGIARKGLVLASIMKFKQICNHPDQYLGQAEFDGKYSGKFEKLAEICETVREKRERILVFTQFREMTEPLARCLEAFFGREGLALHGGTPVKKRGELVERFNGADYVPFMVLSLKAGGVGLNLTAANHVAHFDRWWNPAIENQATDRAYRIGQNKNVLVHKFITSGTIEEKIDRMIEEKQSLADGVVAASGENWITEMSDNELMNLFSLEA